MFSLVDLLDSGRYVVMYWQWLPRVQGDILGSCGGCVKSFRLSFGGEGTHTRNMILTNLCRVDVSTMFRKIVKKCCVLFAGFLMETTNELPSMLM